MYKVAIIGSREFKNKALLDAKMKEIQIKYPIQTIISGGAKGADTLAVQWANKNDIETVVYYPDFKKHKRAYHFRNRQIVHHADIIVAFWNARSTGTRYTLNYARALEKITIVIKY